MRAHVHVHPRGVSRRPSLAMVDDLTAPGETVQRLRAKLGVALRPFLEWMAEECEMEGADEEVGFGVWGLGQIGFGVWSGWPRRARWRGRTRRGGWGR